MIDLTDLLNRHRPDWYSDANCLGLDASLFFADAPGPNMTGAKAVCAGCSVADQCLKHAMDTHEFYGVWGGTSPKQRRKLREGRPIRRHLKPCGTPAAYRRHKDHGEEPCDVCIEGMREEWRRGRLGRTA